MAAAWRATLIGELRSGAHLKIVSKVGVIISQAYRYNGSATEDLQVLVNVLPDRVEVLVLLVAKTKDGVVAALHAE